MKALGTLLRGAVCCSIRVVPDVLHHVLQSQPGLGGRGDDLIGWQDESVATGVPELEGEGVLDAQVVGPVDAAAAGLICRSKAEGWKASTEEITHITRQNLEPPFLDLSVGFIDLMPIH